MDGSDVFVEFCTVIETDITSIMTGWNITEREVRYINRTLPKHLSLIDTYAYFLEVKHDCQTSHPDQMQCTWLTQVRGQITLLFAKMGGRANTGYDDIDLKTLITTLKSILSDLLQVGSELEQEIFALNEELEASESLDLRHGRPVVILEKLDRFRELVERATELEKAVGCPEHGLPLVCNAFWKIRESTEPILVMGSQYGKLMMDANNELTKDEL